MGDVVGESVRSELPTRLEAAVDDAGRYVLGDAVLTV